MRVLRVVSILTVVCLVAACAGIQQTQPKSAIDTQIMYRSQFNTALQQLNFELSTMPPDQQKAWAQKVIPFVSACSVALDAMDVEIGTGSSPSPENVQAYLTAKNQMIDTLAQIVLAKKGGK